MHEVLTIATVLGLAGVALSFLIFFILQELKFSYIYATAWFVFNNFLTVSVYRMLHRTKWLLGREHAHEAIE